MPHNLSIFSFPFSIFSIFAPLYFLILEAGDMAKKKKKINKKPERLIFSVPAVLCGGIES